MKKYIKSDISWDYFDKFDPISEEYLPDRGEGDNMATQIVTAINKLVYKWYNDGDVFDNTHGMEGWWNDLSSYANWLYNNIPGADDILVNIEMCSTDSEYENLLKDLADYCLDAEFLKTYATTPKKGSVYECSGPFKFVEEDEDEDEDEDYDDDYDEEDEDEWV